MAILNPFGVICGSAQPIQKGHFQLMFSSPAGRFSEQDNLDILTFPALHQQVDVKDFIAFNSQIPYAGNKLKVQETATFRFFDKSKGFKFWNDWFKKVYDSETDQVGIIDDYVGTGEVTIFKPGGTAKEDMQPWGKIKIDNCWPSSVGPDQLDMSSDEQWGYTVVLQVIDATFEVN